jgi:hypothetical protein
MRILFYFWACFFPICIVYLNHITLAAVMKEDVLSDASNPIVGATVDLRVLITCGASHA